MGLYSTAYTMLPHTTTYTAISHLRQGIYEIPQVSESVHFKEKPQTILSADLKMVFTQLLKTLRASDNWNGYGSPAPKVQTIQRAIPFLVACLGVGLIPNDIGASPEGGMALSFFKDDGYVAVEFYDSGETLALLAQKGVESTIWEPETDQKGVLKLIATIFNFLRLTNG
jgi:hypothetical protein